jgi:hypothetical protein
MACFRMVPDYGMTASIMWPFNRIVNSRYNPYGNGSDRLRANSNNIAGSMGRRGIDGELQTTIPLSHLNNRGEDLSSCALNTAAHTWLVHAQRRPGESACRTMFTQLNHTHVCFDRRVGSIRSDRFLIDRNPGTLCLRINRPALWKRPVDNKLLVWSKQLKRGSDWLTRRQRASTFYASFNSTIMIGAHPTLALCAHNGSSL